MTENDSTERARPQDEEPAEGSRDTVDQQLEEGSFSDTGGDDPTMGGSSDGDTSA